MDDFIKQEEEYKKRKIEYLQNEKPFERYRIVDIHSGFIIYDRLAHKNHEDKLNYLLESACYKVDDNPNPRYKSINDFMELLNSLDRQVNGNLYADEHQGLLISKKLLYDKIERKLDFILNKECISGERFNVSYGSNVNSDNPLFFDEILIDVYVYRKGLHDLAYQRHELVNNMIFNRLFEVINDDESELEKKEDYIGVDTLIELKLRLLDGLSTDNLLKEF